MFVIIFILFSLAIPSQCATLYNSTEVIERQKLFEKGGFYQGDMRMSKEQESRVGIIDRNYRWSRIVPFVFGFGSDAYYRKVILNALTQMEQEICLRFVERTNQRDYVYIQHQNSGCWSYVGRQRGGQILNLEIPGCISTAIIMHEFMHALGFEHEHSAPNRDKYITIHMENVNPESSHNFKLTSWYYYTFFNLSYDYLSIMHYSAYAFSVNGRRTITTKDPTMQNVIGQRSGMSRTDIIRINRMYTCPGDQYQRRQTDKSSKVDTMNWKHYLFINLVSMLLKYF